MITPKRITLKHIARAAGCSVSATSKVLNQVRGGAGVGADLRQRILTCAEQLGYQTNQAARSLKQGRSNAIAVLLGSQPNVTFWAQLSNSLQEAARTAGQRIYTVTSYEELLDLHSARRIDAAIYLRGAYAAQYFARLRQLPIPSVSIDVEHRDAEHAELIPNLQAATFAAIKSLKQQNKREIVWLHPSFDGQRIDGDRFPFVQAACNEFQLTLHERAVPSPIKAYKETDAQAAYQSLVQFYKTQHADGLLIYNDIMLSGALAALHQQQLRIPDDVAICSYDNISASYMYPPISSIDLGMTELGHAAIHSVLQRIENPDFQYQSDIHAQFIPRQSTGA